jgi:hypothetical protein
MTIQNISTLPNVGTRQIWLKLLNITVSSIVKYEKQGLKAHRPRPQTVLYYKSDILDFFSIEEQETKMTALLLLLILVAMAYHIFKRSPIWVTMFGRGL